MEKVGPIPPTHPVRPPGRPADPDDEHRERGREGRAPAEAPGDGAAPRAPEPRSGQTRPRRGGLVDDYA